VPPSLLAPLDPPDPLDEPLPEELLELPLDPLLELLEPLEELLELLEELLDPLELLEPLELPDPLEDPPDPLLEAPLDPPDEPLLPPSTMGNGAFVLSHASQTPDVTSPSTAPSPAARTDFTMAVTSAGRHYSTPAGAANYR